MRWLTELLFPNRKRSDDPPEGSVLHFHHNQVEACMETLNPHLARLRLQYPDTAVAAALAMHTVIGLTICVSDDKMTRDEARHMVLKIAALEFEELDLSAYAETRK
jgi:hypothetical protein